MSSYFSDVDYYLSEIPTLHISAFQMCNVVEWNEPVDSKVGERMPGVWLGPVGSNQIWKTKARKATATLKSSKSKKNLQNKPATFELPDSGPKKAFQTTEAIAQFDWLAHHTKLVQEATKAKEKRAEEVARFLRQRAEECRAILSCNVEARKANLDNAWAIHHITFKPKVNDLTYPEIQWPAD